MRAAFPGALAKPILSKNSKVVLSCHQGLSAEEITYDCLEKARALIQVGLAYQASLSETLPLPYLALLDDMLEIGLEHAESVIDMLPPRFQSVNRSTEAKPNTEVVNEML
jgi:hypothetical protein